MNAEEELAQIAKRLKELARQGDDRAIAHAISELRESAEGIGKSASGSWLGYHALVYYEGFARPPANAHFDHEWGLMDEASSRTRGHWTEYDYKEVVEAILEEIRSPSLNAAQSFYNDAREKVELYKSEAMSILQTYADSNDQHLTSIGKKISEVKVVGPDDVIDTLAPTSKSVVTEDTSAANRGTQTPPHVDVLAQAIAMRLVRESISSLIKLIRQAVSHILRQQTVSPRKAAVGTNVFIGHGHSAAWRELKDFIENRLGLQTDEFNRVPVAGVPNTKRLEQMLNSAAMAFLVLTGEDEQPDGKSHARLNVVHEAGLFQGKLGFERAIVLLEKGCEEFSNIDGLGQLRFAKGEIGSKFEEIRRVLEREGLLKVDETGQALPDDSTA